MKESALLNLLTLLTETRVAGKEARAVAATAGADGDGAVVAAVVGEGPIGVAARTLENRPISSAARAYFD